MNKEHVRTKIYAWFKKKKIKIRENDNILKDKILDSFDIIDFITFVENSFSIKFDKEELQDVSLLKIKKFIKLIEKKVSVRI